MDRNLRHIPPALLLRKCIAQGNRSVERFRIYHWAGWKCFTNNQWVHLRVKYVISSVLIKLPFHWRIPKGGNRYGVISNGGSLCYQRFIFRSALEQVVDSQPRVRKDDLWNYFWRFGNNARGKVIHFWHTLRDIVIIVAPPAYVTLVPVPFLPPVLTGNVAMQTTFSTCELERNSHIFAGQEQTIELAVFAETVQFSQLLIRDRQTIVTGFHGHIMPTRRKRRSGFFTYNHHAWIMYGNMEIFPRFMWNLSESGYTVGAQPSQGECWFGSFLNNIPFTTVFLPEYIHYSTLIVNGQ